MKTRVFAALAAACLLPAFGQQIEFSKEQKAVVKHYRFAGNHREESMWSALYGAKSGKIYIGLCTHAEAAHFYEFDPATETMRHIVDLTELHGERGEGINTNGKIHVRMGEDPDGNIYFGSLNEDTGPENIDPSSYLGAFWYRYNVKLDKVEVLGKINRHFGLLGMVMDPKYMRLYGLAEDGHLYMVCGEKDSVCRLFSFGPDEGFKDWGVLGVDRSPYYAKIAYQFDSMCTGKDGTIYIGESDRRAKLFIFAPGGTIMDGVLNPTNPR